MKEIGCTCGNNPWLIKEKTIICSQCRLPKEKIYVYEDKDPGEIIKEMNIPVNLPNSIELAKARLLRYKRDSKLVEDIDKIIKDNIKDLYITRD